MHPLLSGGALIPSPREGRSTRDVIKHAAPALTFDCKLTKRWRWAGADRAFFQGPVQGPFSRSQSPQGGHSHVCGRGVVRQVCSQTSFEHPGSVLSNFFFNNPMCSKSHKEPGCLRTCMCRTVTLCGDPMPISGDHTKNQHGQENAGSVWGPSWPHPLLCWGMPGSCPCLTPVPLVSFRLMVCFQSKKCLQQINSGFPNHQQRFDNKGVSPLPLGMLLQRSRWLQPPKQRYSQPG